MSRPAPSEQPEVARLRPRGHGFAPAALCLGLSILLAASASVHAGDSEVSLPAGAGSGDQPVISAAQIEQIAEGEMLLSGDVDLRYGELRLLADTVHYNDRTHMVEARGNVVLMFGRSQISGDRLEMNVETKLATVWNAHGYMDPDVVFEAERLERIADDKVVITDATVTTCTQPTPYWSFHVSKATLHLDHYAHMRNVSFRVEKAPLIYLPYLIWPMKRDRASGLLLPNVGYSKQRGSFIGNALYLVMGRSQDATLFFDKYGRTGTGLGLEYRFVPAERGEGIFTGYYLNDTVDDPVTRRAQNRERYRFKLQQSQKFRNGFNMLAEINEVSDLDYYLDFERDIRQTTSPTVFSHVDLVRNWTSYAFNFRADRQEQFISQTEDLTLQRLPELELRGRGVRFGRSPIYLSFETSAGVFKRDRRFEDPNTGIIARDTTYQRLDLFPTISASFTPTPWLDISPSVSARETYYSRSLVDPDDPLSTTTAENVTREFAAFNLQVVGPRLFRIFGDPRLTDAASFKHTFEPRVSYSYVPEVSGGDNVIRFDEVDSLAGDVNRVTYSLTSRLFAKRPPRPKQAAEIPGASPADGADLTGQTQVQVPVAEIKDLPDEIKEAVKDQAREPGVGTIEVATFDLSQSYSLDQERPLSRATPIEPDGTPAAEVDAQAGPLVATMRYNPSSAASLDLRASYDVLFDDVKEVSLSANVRSLQHGYLRLSWFLNRDLSGSQRVDDMDPNDIDRVFNDASQVRLIGGTAFLQRRITLDLEGSYDIEGSDLRDQRYRVGYNTQCCGMLVEVARRDFQTINEIEYRFTLNLRGVGTFLDLQGRAR